MSFSGSSENVRVDDGHILRASLRNLDGDLIDAEMDLNQILGNSNGQFEWGGENFSGSAQNIVFQNEGDENSPVLRAELDDGNGNWVARDINLNERIGNDNGSLNFGKKYNGMNA